LFGDDLAPFYMLDVEGEYVWADITRYIQSIEFEQTVDMVDRLKISVLNPAHAFDVVGRRDSGLASNPELPDFTTHKVFLPGNQVDLWGGYGSISKAVHLGRVKLWRHMPRFPRDQQPMLDIIGYDLGKLMMGERGDITIGSDGMTRAARRSEDEEGNVYSQMTHSEIVRYICDKYGFEPDIDDTDRVDDLFQKRDMSDYVFVRGLANINERDFWIDYDVDRRLWVLHWKSLIEFDSPIYTFRYNQGNASSLLEFEPEYALDDGITELKVMFFSQTTGQWEYLREEGSDAAEADPRYRRGARRGERNTPSRQPDGTLRAGGTGDSLEQEITSASALRLAASGHAIDVISDRPFTSVSDALDFARRWFRARRDSFILGTGKLIGVETLRPRQVHRLEGLGSRLSGDWQFIMVRHQFIQDQGYYCEFRANKIINR
jgi:phage protein D